jgi:hypothetical protein
MSNPIQKKERPHTQHYFYRVTTWLKGNVDRCRNLLRLMMMMMMMMTIVPPLLLLS